MRISVIQNEMGLLKSTSDDPQGAGIDTMEFVPFSDEMNFRSLNTEVMEHVVPALGETGGQLGPSHHR